MAIDNTTQVNNPGRATLRTIVQGAIGIIFGLGLLAPQILDALTEGARAAGFEEFAVAMTGGGAAVLAVAGFLARLMAIPGVEQFLQATPGFRWLAARKVPKDNGPGDLGFDASLSGYAAHDLTTDDRIDDPEVYTEADDAGIIEDGGELPPYVENETDEDGEPKHREGH